MNDLRIRADRRKQSMPFLPRQILFGGRRRTIRRKADKWKYTLLDIYGSPLLMTLLLLLILSILDAYLTLTLVTIHGAVELNPIMAAYLEYGNTAFFVQKFLLTSAAIFIFCIFNRIAAVRIALILSIVLYLGIVYYELTSLSSLSSGIQDIFTF